MRSRAASERELEVDAAEAIVSFGRWAAWTTRIIGVRLRAMRVPRDPAIAFAAGVAEVLAFISALHAATALGCGAGARQKSSDASGPKLCGPRKTLCGTACVDTTSSLEHCGSCFAACHPANASGVCSAGQCRLSACADGWDDCDLQAANGCESKLDSVANCGACGIQCTNANGTTSCVSGACAPACGAGSDDCNGEARDGCETRVPSPVAIATGQVHTCVLASDATVWCWGSNLYDRCGWLSHLHAVGRWHGVVLGRQLLWPDRVPPRLRGRRDPATDARTGVLLSLTAAEHAATGAIGHHRRA